MEGPFWEAKDNIFVASLHSVFALPTAEPCVLLRMFVFRFERHFNQLDLQHTGDPRASSTGISLEKAPAPGANHRPAISGGGGGGSCMLH